MTSLLARKYLYTGGWKTSEYIKNNVLTTNLVLELLPTDMQPSSWADKSGNGYDCTPTGVVWKGIKNGLMVPYFGGDDYFKNSTAGWRSADSQGAIGIFLRTSSVSSTLVPFASGDEASATRFLRIRKMTTTGFIRIGQRNNDTEDSLEGAVNIADGKWHSVFVTSTGTAYGLVIDGVADTLSVLTGANSGDWFADTLARDNFTVGALVINAISGYWVGEIGLVLVYSIAPSTAQILTMHKALIRVFP